jgi:GxxExxY protein
LRPFASFAALREALFGAWQVFHDEWTPAVPLCLTQRRETHCVLVRQTSYDIHSYHGHGRLEKSYENALAHRLRKAGLEVHQQHPIKVYDEDGTLIGDYLADLLVDGCLVIEPKKAKAIAPEHEAQILGYLKSSTLENELLINFGSYNFEIRKYARTEDSSKRRKGYLGSLLFVLSAFFAVKL